MKEYKVTFRSGMVLTKVPAKNVNQAKILAQAEMIVEGHPYAIKRIQIHKEEG